VYGARKNQTAKKNRSLHKASFLWLLFGDFLFANPSVAAPERGVVRRSSSTTFFLTPVKGEAGKLNLVKGEHYCHTILRTRTIRKRTEHIFNNR
jgi:hypothetical protein